MIFLDSLCSSKIETSVISIMEAKLYNLYGFSYRSQNDQFRPKEIGYPRMHYNLNVRFYTYMKIGGTFAFKAAYNSCSLYGEYKPEFQKKSNIKNIDYIREQLFCI